jgi:hypothetical protein
MKRSGDNTHAIFIVTIVQRKKIGKTEFENRVRIIVKHIKT